MSDNRHTCGWPGCTVQVPASLWGCSPHWRKLPKRTQKAIKEAERVGLSSPEYREAHGEAVAFANLVSEVESQRQRAYFVGRYGKAPMTDALALINHGGDRND